MSFRFIYLNNNIALDTIFSLAYINRKRILKVRTHDHLIILVLVKKNDNKTKK